MSKKLLNSAALLSFVLLLFSFTDNRSERSKSSQTCSNYVSVYASGLTIIHVSITVGGQDFEYNTDITSGTYAYYNSPYFVQGASINVAVSIYGQGGAPRMNSLEVGNQCNAYNNVTQGNITGIQTCNGITVAAYNTAGCP